MSIQNVWAALHAEGLTGLPYILSNEGDFSLVEGADIPPAKVKRIREIIASEMSPASQLTDGKAVLLVNIDAEAERQRLRWITPGAGQAMTYQRKTEEAYRLEADQDPDPADYPMLWATVGIDGSTLQEVAAVVRDMDSMWSRIGGAIERNRSLLKKQASEATSLADLGAIDISAGWPEG